jgi:steroid 5-alpha reductase family enzyme
LKANTLPSNLHAPLGPRDYAAFGLFAGSFLLEAFADRQKSAWRIAKENKEHDEKFISKGLWGTSRHPKFDSFWFFK